MVGKIEFRAPPPGAIKVAVARLWEPLVGGVVPDLHSFREATFYGARQALEENRILRERVEALEEQSKALEARLKFLEGRTPAAREVPAPAPSKKASASTKGKHKRAPAKKAKK